MAQRVKNLPAMWETCGSVPGLGISPAEANSYPLQYSGLEKSMDCIVHRVAKSWTWLSDFHFHFTLICLDSFSVLGSKYSQISISEGSAFVDTTSFYIIMNLSIHGFWDLWRVLEPIPCAYQGTTVIKFLCSFWLLIEQWVVLECSTLLRLSHVGLYFKKGYTWKHTSLHELILFLVTFWEWEITFYHHSGRKKGGTGNEK